jgi:hypothetical protein
MGIEIHMLNLLLFAAKRQPLGRVATIGRLGLHVPPHKLKERLMKVGKTINYGAYCEDFLKNEFGAHSVDSFDKSAYEGASHIVDMSKPLADSHDAYDTVIDGGCLEHIYNAPQALKNISVMCAQKGQILHCLPANNLCGHGFWQFSPTLFFSLYSEKNGYKETQVFLADVVNEHEWYEVREPRDSARIEIVSSSSVFVMVRTIKNSQISHDDVQQADYVHAWNNTGDAAPGKEAIQGWIPRVARHSPFIPLGRFIERKWQRFCRPTKSLSTANPNLVRQVVKALA